MYLGATLISILLLIPLSIYAISDIDSISTTDNHFRTHYKTPVVCIMETDDKQIMHNTINSIREWQNKLQDYNPRDSKWIINTIIVAPEQRFQYAQCTIIVHFLHDSNPRYDSSPDIVGSTKYTISNNVTRISPIEIDIYIEKICVRSDVTCNRGIDNVFTHEFGHALGLDHIIDVNSIMIPNVCFVNVVSISDSDIATLKHVYNGEGFKK